MPKFTAPGLSNEAADEVAGILQERLSALNDLHLTLKHIHWNVVGANFIGVHEMIDPQVELVRGYADTIAERLAADRQVFRALPAVPLEPCEKRSARVSSTALVRYRTNDYSVPTAYGFRDVLVKGFVDEVVISIAGEEIARHPRSYGEGAFVANPLHYLALIEQKPGALDQAAALQGWDLPEIFQHLRHLLEARMGNKGKREFIQVLRLLEALPLAVVTDAVTQAVQLGAIGFDAVKLIALARIERRPPRLDLAAYPHLPRTDVKTTRAADYGVLAA